MRMNSDIFHHSMEHRYILQILRAFLTNEPKVPSPPAPFKLNRFIALIKHHNLGPICSFVMEKTGNMPELVQSWHQERRGMLLRNIKITKSAIWMFTLLEKHQISAVGFRGLNVAYRFYPLAELRSMRDVDILIHSDDCARFKEVLKREGYLPHRVLRSQFIYNINDIPFEIHWSYLTPKRYRHVITTEHLLSDRIKLPTADGLLFCLKPEYEMTGLIAHAFIHHHLDNLRQLVDIGLLLVNDDLDWDKIAKWCREARLTRLFNFTLSFVNRLFKLDKQECFSVIACKLPSNVDQMYAAFAAALWGKDRLRDRIMRQAALLYVAERPVTKLKQLLRFAAADQIGPLLNLTFSGRLSRVGGVESKPGKYGTAESRDISEL